VGERRAEGLEQIAEGVLTIGRSDGPETTELSTSRPRHRAVVGEDPVTTPKLAHERMRIRQARSTARAPANVSDRQERLDWVLAQEACKRAMRGRRRLEEDACRLALVERQAPPVGVRAGPAPALAQSGERENDVGWDVALHPQ